VKIFLLRHCRALGRAEWEGDAGLRPLSEAGESQAEALVAFFAEAPPVRIVSAPPLRCQQSVLPLAEALGIDVEVDERLGRGEPVARLLELLPTWDEGPLLLCTHAAPIVSLLRVLELVEDDAPVCRKGSVWTLEGNGYTPAHASYAEPLQAAPAAGGAISSSAGGIAPREDARVRAAVLDLGSTSFTLLVADVWPDGAVHRVVREKVMLRLGAEISDGRKVPGAVAERACEVARELAEVARREKVEQVFPVATAALRAARNGERVAARIGRALGHPVRILSGEEEARTIFRAFQQRLDLGDDRVVGVDLGGGSLELALGCAERIRREATLELGAVRVQREFVTHDPMRPRTQRAIREHVASALAEVAPDFAARDSDVAIATGGSVRALARLVDERTAQRGPRPELPVLTVADLRELRRVLVESTQDERLAMRGMRKTRADLLPTAALILEACAESLGIEAWRVCDWGLREGILLDALLPRRG